MIYPLTSMAAGSNLFGTIGPHRYQLDLDWDFLFFNQQHLTSRKGVSYFLEIMEHQETKQRSSYRLLTIRTSSSVVSKERYRRDLG